MSRFYLVAAVLSVFVAACGSSTETSAAPSAGDPTTTTVGTATTVAPPTTTTTADTATTTTIPATSTTSSTMPGELIDFFVESGDILSVVGVAHDDVLNVRVRPGVLNDIVDTLDPTETVEATGLARDLGLAIWVELDTGSVEGWSNFALLAYGGVTDDATSEVIGLLGEIPTAETMEALGLIVAESLASTDPQSFIVMSVAPTLGDLGEVTYDVLGLGDDAVYGYRLHVFGEPVDDGFSLRSVERTFLCGRGVDEELLCV